ncbi:unnamed protein product (macronuclear) [Paramecium tetraurelia]|uniref:EGF-like domain-containing protein n=1 Tax=Paramecium tetraurelia TaxID=5888 RepID=A0CKZ6_PARTE|nr:uncharacterized protein GSPATT00008010001 [Paramecium tetraurelia]CAK71463.1 unnamed protein product [Paramecium tetraurelia]|eukprot:XP_001438860.1 hypothetical protein (macronuclear) [Paramecium tetraurelia strain d4-2]
MQTIRILFSIFVISQSQWQLVSEDLLNFSVSSSNWNYGNTCNWDSGSTGGGGSVSGCSANDIEYILVGSYKVRAYYSVQNLPPHYQVKVVVDGYFLDSDRDNIYYVSYEVQGSTPTYSLQYKDSTLQGYEDACRGSWGRFEVQTFIMTFSHTDYSEVRFRVCGTLMDSRNYGVRGLQIYVNQCHWSCLKCSSNLITGCLACFTAPSTTFATSQSCGSCPTNKAFIEYIDDTKSCVVECHYYRVPDSNNVCQFNANMFPYTTYFDTTSFSQSSPWVFVPDPINYNLLYSKKISSIPCDTSKNYVGPFLYNEAFSLTLQIPYNISYIRFRATIVKLNDWVDYSAVHVLLDQVEFASVYTIGQVFTSRNADYLYSESICTPTVGYFRFEAKLKSNITNPVLTLQGSMDQFGQQSWGFRDVVMDIMRCQPNCDWCDFDQKCYSCSSGFLYKNKCVLSCPTHSVQQTGVCKDFDEIVDNSKYLIKAFYDSSNTTDTDVSNIVGTITNGGSDFTTSDGFLSTNIKVYFSYYMGKRVLGGPLVWNSATFTKPYTLNPHYKFRFKFTLVLGDEFSGDFQYTIGGTSQTLQYSDSGFALTSKEVGRDKRDKYITIDRTIGHTSPSFSVQMTCNSDRSIKNNFCLVYDYFIIILECTQYCTACSGPTWADCSGKQALPTEMSSPTTCINNAYYFDNTVTPAVCRACTPSYCLECQNAYICTKCASNFYLQNGKCQCYPWTYLTVSNTCQSCHPLCESCYGSNSNQCLSCNSYQHRYLNNNICVCQNSYYDDGVDYKCQSICGDMIVTEGEDCDDGNTIRFDGCNNCRYECQKECLSCVQGQCSVCAPGYTLQKTMKICYPTCGNSSLVSQEQCEDNNLTPYDGCYNCQFQCQPQCTNCIYGKCYECDNSIGYYINLATFKCVTYCGDQIVAGGEMCDDGNNNPFDGCNSCAYSCDSFCALCIFGICTKCKSGFQLLNQTGQCAPICGDKLITYYEACDDGNEVNSDGCSQCTLTCQEQCTSCLLGVCLECNTPGYYLNPKLKKCTSICGDTVLSVLNEQCDDGNNTFEDGCYQCKYECQTECLTCAAGICYSCKPNFYLSSDNTCLPICGDGVISKFEPCDDYNFVIEDGCAQCSYQCETSCTQCQFGICKLCQSGYYLNQSIKKCLPICGDTLILGDEQCDVGIIPFEDTVKNTTGCISCQLKCSPQCEICTQGQCQKCKESLGWYLDYQTSSCYTQCGDSIISDYEECEDFNSQLNDGCSQCVFKCQQECSICIFGLCQQCNQGYTLINQKCLPVCGDGIVAGDEECDTGIIDFEVVYCVNCKYRCAEGCNNCVYGTCLECKNNYGFYLNQNHQCESKCGDLIISNNEICDENSEACESCNFVCDDNCNNCKFGICQGCNLGYELLLNRCVSICGDSIQTSIEDCESHDIVPFDGCYLCQFQCQDECQQCINGECILCNQAMGWYLLNKKCETKCGDGIIAGLEECDVSLNYDNGDVSNNKCFNCRLSCAQNCSNCDRGICQSCQDGYLLTVYNECVNICGNLNTEDFEVCDDGNINGFDGCFSCQHDCQSECQECVNGVCILCEDGFELDEDTQQCQSKCGDMILTQHEECDDGNYIPYDGCYNCKYSCTENCDICVKGVCQSCSQRFVLSFPKCIPDCKDISYTQNADECYPQKQCQSECVICIKGDQHNCESMCGDEMIVGQEQCEGFLNYANDDPYCNNECQFACPSNCVTCSLGVCQQCQRGFYLIENKCFHYCGDSLMTEFEICDDNNLTPFDGCFQCRLDCEEQCTLCIEGVCQMCQRGYEIIDGHCFSVYCDDQNSIKHDGCNQCRFECDKNCSFCEFNKCIFCANGFELSAQTCISVCGDGLIVGNEKCDDGNLINEDGCFECQYACQQQCQTCLYGSCILCNEDKGWYVTSQGDCQPLCGDNKVAGLEQCDDGNDQNFDGCYECSYICQKSCTKCINGLCYECNTPGWRLENYFCWEICGDALKVGIEECDDGNDVPYDGCFDCKTQCEEACVVCSEGQCQVCAYGWQLNENHRCGTICGDQYVVPRFEDCDDGNLLPYDGCYECNYQCVQHCTDCRESVCYECNTPGWTYESITQKCIPVCGDGELNGYEQCDDGNIFDNDGCSNTCEYQCHIACLTCDRGKCLECDRYLGYFVSNNQCASKCGDGLWEQNTEQCDDGNLLNQDGCDKNCKIEVDWYCKNEPMQISNCFFKRQPSVELKLLSQEERTSKIEVTFSTQMMLQKNYILFENENNNPTLTDFQLFMVKVDELNQGDFDYTIEPVVGIQEFPQEVKYIIDLKLLKNISYDQINVIIVVDKKLIISEDFVKLEQNSGQIKISIPFIQDELSQKVVELFSNANEISIYTTMCVSLVSIFSTGYSNLFMTLDTIQYLYYTRYINMEFPQNLQQNMDNLKKSSVSSMVTNKLKQTGLSQKMASQPKENNEQEQGMPNKFKQDNLHYQFSSNIQTTAVALSIGLSIFLTTLSISKLLHLIPPHKLNDLGGIIGGGILKVRSKCTKISNDFVYSGAIRLITVNFYEMQFASLIQLSHVSFNSYSDIANNSGAVATLAFTCIFTSLLIHRIRQIQTKQSLTMKHYIKTLFQSDEKSYLKSTWQMQYNTILLVKKSVYMFIIVCFQNQGLYQTLGVATQAAAFATYLAVSSPFSNSEDQIKQLITELGMMANTLSFSAYYTYEYFSISKESLSQIGWFNIGIFTTILTSNLAIDFSSQARVLYKKVKRSFNKFMENQMPTQSRVQPIFV